MNELASLQLRVDSTDVGEAQKQLGGLTHAGGVAERATDGLTAASRRLAGQTQQTVGIMSAMSKGSGALPKVAQEAQSATKNLRLMRGGVSQLGFQVQDIAVQLQSGTNAMVVFGQQGSQIASLFGPAGAIAGAIIAIGAAVGGTLVSGLFDAESATDRLEDSLDRLDKRAKIVEGGIVSLSTEIRELAKTSGTAAALELQAGIVAGMEAIESATELASEKLDDFISPGFLNDSKYVTEAFKTLGAQQRDATDVLEAFANDNDRYWKIVQEDARGTMQSVQDVSVAYINLNKTVGDLEEKYGATRTEAIALAQAFSRVQDDKSLSALQSLQAALDDIADNKGASAEVIKFTSELRQTVIEAEKAGVKVEALKEQLDRIGSGLGLSDPEGEKKTLDNFERIESRLAQQVALYGEVGAAAQVRYQVENGLIEGINEEQGKILIGLAEDFDAKKRIEDATKARDRELQQYQSIEERLSSQAALYGVVSEEVKIRYQLENGLLGELDSAQQQNLINLSKKIDLKRKLAEDTKNAERDEKERASALSRLEEYLNTEEEAIQKSHARRRQIILENTEAGSKQQEDLLRRLTEKTAEEIENAGKDIDDFSKNAAENIQRELGDTIKSTLTGDFDDIASSWGDMLASMGAQLIAADLSRLLGLEELAGGSGGGSFIGSALGAVGGFLGFKDGGGSVGPGQYAIVGERRPEIVMGPAQVVGGDQTSKMMGNSVGSITINMNGGGGERENRRAAGEIARQVKRAVSEAGRY